MQDTGEGAHIRPGTPSTLAESSVIANDTSSTTPAHGDISSTSLLDVPPPVKGWPTPWLTRQELDDFVLQMSRRGWTVRSLVPSDASQMLLSASTTSATSSVGDQSVDYAQSSKKKEILHAIAQFPFTSYDAALEFVGKVGRMANDELHHPEMIVTSSKTVMLWMTTHSARPGKDWAFVDEAPLPSAKDKPVKPPHLRKVPGLTRRDSRLAVLIENLYTTEYSSGIAREVVAGQPDTKTLHEQLLSLINGRSVSLPKEPAEDAMEPLPPSGNHWVYDCKQFTPCPACGGDHTLFLCIRRSFIPPTKPCSLCGEEHRHWMVDCPLYVDRHEAKHKEHKYTREEKVMREVMEGKGRDGRHLQKLLERRDASEA
ncbi:hypothetical protein EV121DRAFT_285775 [Schizophyllum commune]